MKRYFDLHSQMVTVELDIIDGSQASTASIDEFKKHFKTDDVKEVTLSEYNNLTKQYTS